MSKFKEKVFIGIDPGKNGGIAILNDITGEEVAFRCPKKPDDMFVLFAAGVDGSSENVDCFVEFVHAFPGQGVVSTFSFGQNLGQWEGVIASQEVDINFVNPRKWMEHYSVPPRLQKKDRKRFLRDIAEKLFPNLKMTFNISDALLIANYGRELYYKENLSGRGRGKKP
tara:strand:+ start:54 stop:560 length:507 start_codon:yes stop_codon:yes gene_type:complete